MFFILKFFIVAVSIDCPLVINLANSLHMTIGVISSFQSDCCAASGSLVVCNGSNRVIQLNWANMLLYGVVNTTLLPPSLTLLDLSYNSLAGPIPLLPLGLIGFFVQGNAFNGTISLLPSTLVYLYLSLNNIFGAVPSLPSGLAELGLSGNRFTGNLPLLPSTLQYVYITGSFLSGSVLLNQPIGLYINYNYITDLEAQDISRLMGTECNLSNNPLLGNSDITPFISKGCTINGLYFASSLPNTLSYISKQSTSTKVTSISSSLPKPVTSRVDISEIFVNHVSQFRNLKESSSLDFYTGSQSWNFNTVERLSSRFEQRFFSFNDSTCNCILI